MKKFNFADKQPKRNIILLHPNKSEPLSNKYRYDWLMSWNLSIVQYRAVLSFEWFKNGMLLIVQNFIESGILADFYKRRMRERERESLISIVASLTTAVLR